MNASKAAHETLAQGLGFVYNPEERSLDELLECTVAGFVAMRELGLDVAPGRADLQLFIYDYLPRVEFKDDIKVRPNQYLCTEAIGTQLRRLFYDHFYVVLDGELVQVSAGHFSVLCKYSNFQYLHVQTTDYFYL